MAEYEKRFKGFSQEEISKCIGELEAQALTRGARHLTAEDIEDLLLLLPANYFKILFGIRIREIARRAKEFAHNLGDLDEAVEKLTQECRRLSEDEEEGVKNDILRMMDNLRLSDPVLWFRVYQKVRTYSLSSAIELETWDKGKPFEKP